MVIFIALKSQFYALVNICNETIVNFGIGKQNAEDLHQTWLSCDEVNIFCPKRVTPRLRSPKIVTQQWHVGYQFIVTLAILKLNLGSKFWNFTFEV